MNMFRLTLEMTEDEARQIIPQLKQTDLSNCAEVMEQALNTNRENEPHKTVVYQTEAARRVLEGDESKA